jgi:hypothetical protein
MSSPASGLSRWWFVVSVLLGGAIFWVVKRPPMGDLPQHAGQVELLRDLMSSAPRWGDLVHVNYFTPYWVPISLATILSAFVPIVVALKLLLTAAFFAFVAAGVALRREVDGDPRLDWLLLPGFFGFAYHYGFYTFLVAAPLGLLFILFSRRFAMAPTPRRALQMVAVGALLFLSHGLVFLFAVGAGGAMVLWAGRNRLALRLAPFLALGLLALVYLVSARLRESGAAGEDLVDWGWDWGILHRIVEFPMLGATGSWRDLLLAPVVPLMLVAPWLLGGRLQRDGTAFMPLAVILLVWLAAPRAAMRTDFLYERFALFLLPVFAIVFRRSEAVSAARARAAEIGIALLSVAFLSVVLVRAWRFDQESAPFETVLAAARPGERALSVMLDATSDAAHAQYAYHSYPAWYQAERQGFVDFNFAAFLPEIVRFRTGKAPPLPADVEAFDWKALNAATYRYFFVRHTAALPPHLFDNDECAVRLVSEAGPWMLFERGECRTPAR